MQRHEGGLGDFGLTGIPWVTTRPSDQALFWRRVFRLAHCEIGSRLTRHEGYTKNRGLPRRFGPSEVGAVEVIANFVDDLPIRDSPLSVRFVVPIVKPLHCLLKFSHLCGEPWNLAVPTLWLE